MSDSENLKENSMKSEKTNNQAKAIRVRSSVKAGSDQVQDKLKCNHNQPVARAAKRLLVKSSIKAGINDSQHNQRLALDRKSSR